MYQPAEAVESCVLVAVKGLRKSQCGLLVLTRAKDNGFVTTGCDDVLVHASGPSSWSHWVSLKVQKRNSS